MELTQDDVIHILKLIDEAPMGHLSLQVGDFKLEVSKGTGGRPAVQPPLVLPTQPAVAVAEKLLAAPTVAEPAPSRQSALATEALASIKAPLLGIFYRCPQPGTPSYVEEGSLVEEDTTVALIEVMKLFNPVKAGVRGRIVSICVENGSLVEYEQDLFQVEPE